VRVIVLVAMLLFSALAVSTVSVVQQFLDLSKALPSKSDFSSGFNAFYEEFVGPRAPGSGGGGDGLI